jgi:hypothetical protein
LEDGDRKSSQHDEAKTLITAAKKFRRKAKKDN